MSKWEVILMVAADIVIWAATVSTFFYYDRLRSKNIAKSEELWDKLLEQCKRQQKFIIECDDARKALLKIANLTINNLCPSCAKNAAEKVRKLVDEYNETIPDDSSAPRMAVEMKHGLEFESGASDKLIENLRKLNNTPAVDDEWPDTI